MKVQKIMAMTASAAILMGVSACGGGANANNASTTEDGKIVIKIQSFSGGLNFDDKGAGLYAQYEKDHPNVKIEETAVASSDDARSAFNTAISSGTNAYDIYSADAAWMPSITAMPDKFVDLSSYTTDNDWLSWKEADAKSADGKLVGAGIDIGPTAVCYRSDLFAKAGLPTDRDEVAALLGGDNADWDAYFKVGKEYHEKTGLPWYDSMAAVWGVMKTQVEEIYEKKDGTVVATDDTIKKLYDQLTATTDMSSHLTNWTDDWNAAFKTDDGFATTLCPSWLGNTIKGNTGEDFTGWDIADVAPGGGANQGGSFLVVPESSPNKEEAAKLVAWLTAPEQQVKSFTTTGSFPSSKTAAADPAITEVTDSYFNDAPTGKIFSDRANAITVAPYRGTRYYDLDTKFTDALSRVDVTQEQTADEAWQQYVDDVKSLS